MIEKGPAVAPPLAELAGEAVTEEVVERRLRRLGSACAVAAAAVLVAAGTIGWTAGRDGAEGWMGSPPVDSFMIALGALLLVLLSSAAHGRILRGAAEAASQEPDDATEPGAGIAGIGDGGQPPSASGPASGRRTARLSAYSWATGVTFTMLTLAAALGTGVALGGKAPFYGLVICLASLLGMLARWPHPGSFELAWETEDAPRPRT